MPEGEEEGKTKGREEENLEPRVGEAQSLVDEIGDGCGILLVWKTKKRGVSEGRKAGRWKKGTNDGDVSGGKRGQRRVSRIEKKGMVEKRGQTVDGSCWGRRPWGSWAKGTSETKLESETTRPLLFARDPEINELTSQRAMLSETL